MWGMTLGLMTWMNQTTTSKFSWESWLLSKESWGFNGFNVDGLLALTNCSSSIGFLANFRILTPVVMFTTHHFLYTNQLKWITPVRFRIHLLHVHYNVPNQQCWNHSCQKSTHHSNPLWHPTKMPASRELPGCKLLWHSWTQGQWSASPQNQCLMVLWVSAFVRR